MSFLNKLLKPALNSYINYQAKKNLPKYDSIVELDGLEQEVEIIRDKWGVAHIYAKNQRDLFFAQGYIHAQERLWQMELTRRVVSGRLSELIGKDVLEVDKICRKFGFKALGEKDEKTFEKHELKPVLYSYVRGINSFLDQMTNPPVEFKLLKITPEQWTMSDCFGMARLLSMQMSRGWEHQFERLRMASKHGLEKAMEVFPEYPATNPTALNMGIETNQRLNGLLEAFKGPFLNAVGGSNNWVVAADKMDTGAAALCNDPHLLINTPNIWFENHLVAPDYENTGVSIPGVPMVMIGHNRDIAWGATLSYADIQDTYIEKFTSDACRQYHFGDRILKAGVRTEKIYIKGQKVPHEETVLTTHHGPAMLDIDATSKLVLCSKALQDNDMILGFYKLNMSKNWDDFVDACSLLTIPSLSLVYADTQDNIGYYMTGDVPIRKRAKGLLPSDGSDGEHEWEGFVPFNELPHAFNPKQGYFYTCNHKIVNDDYPHDLGEVWMNGYRAKRLEELFQSKSKYSFDDFANWQVDFHCAPGLEFGALIKELQSKAVYQELSPRAKSCSDILVEWKGDLSAESTAGAIYQVLKQQLLDLIFDDFADSIRGVITSKELPIFELSEHFGHDTFTLLRLFANPSSKWWVESPDQTLVKALAQAELYLTEALGTNISAWKWGSLHKITAKHALSPKSPMDEIFDVGTVPIGGDPDTVCQVSFLPGKHYDGSMVAASYRQMIDMGNLDNSKCMAPVGQSGNLTSVHYADQFPLWMKGEYKPMVWSRAQVEQYKKHRDVLKPKAK